MSRTRVIADIGINHNGKLDVAIQLAVAAKRAGCDYVKLQKRDPDWCYSPEEMARVMENPSPWGPTVGDKVRGRELSWEQVAEFDAACSQLGVGWSASCFDLKSLRELHERYPKRPFNKVPSALAGRPEFLREVASQRVLTLISGALLDDAGLDAAVAVFEGARCQYVVNHCVGLYPCPPARVNLLAITRLIERFHRKPHCVGVGYSGHETGILPSTLAAMLGASWIERHVTLDRSAYGSDQAASLEPHGLEVLVRDVRSLPLVLGDGDRNPRGDEKRPVTFWRSE